MNLKEGELQLTMTSIFSLEDLAPFFAAICQGVTRQQTKGQGRIRRQSTRIIDYSNSELIDSIIERDFLETLVNSTWFYDFSPIPNDDAIVICDWFRFHFMMIFELVFV